MNDTENNAFSTNANNMSCVMYHRKQGFSQASSPDFIYNSQSKSGLFSKGTNSNLKVVFYAGFDYSISLCIDPRLGTGIIFKISDTKTGEVLYDNQEDNMTTHMEFSSESTRNTTIQVSVPKGKPTDKENEGCLGVLIEQRPTP